MLSALGYMDAFFTILGFHYILALNIEIIIKISRASAQDYKKRVFIYHIFSIILSIAFIFIILSLQNFEFEISKDLRGALTYNLLIWYLGFLSAIAWMCVGIYCKYLVKLKSTSLLNLILLTILSNLSITGGIIFPQILYYCNVSYERFADLNLAIMCVSSSLGAIEFVILILNKKSIRVIKMTIHRYRNKQKRISNITYDSRDYSTNEVLIEINERKQSLSDGGLLCYFFDQVTKEVFNT